MKNQIKRFAVLCIVLAVCLGAAGCKKKDKEEVPTGNVYVPTFKDVSADIEWISGVMSSGSKVIIIGQSYNRETYESEQKMITIDLTSGEQTTKKLEFDNKNEYINGIQAYKDGFVAWVYSYYMPTEEEMANGYYDWGEEHYAFVLFDTEFNEVSRIPLDDFKKKAEEEGGWFYVNNFQVDSEGNIYFTSDTLLYVIDKEGKELCNIKFDNWINGMAPAGDGRMLAIYYDEEYNTVFSVIDVANKKLGDKLENIPGGRGGSGIYPAGDGRLYVNSSTSLFVYDINTQTSEEVLNWIDCDINANRLSGFATLEDGSFIAVSTNYEYLENETKTTIELATIKEVPAASVKQKKNITFATLYPNYGIIEKIIKFNRNNEEYRIKVKTYIDDDYSNYEDALTLFKSDLTSGNAADFFLADSYGVNVENLAAKGALADIKTLIESDPDLKMDDFIPNIMDALSVGGKLYGIGESFTVQTLVGKVADVGTGKSWTFKEVQALMDKHPDAQLLSYSTKTSILQAMLVYSLDSFYDVDTGECRFNSDDFISVLEMCNRFPAEYNWDDEKDDYVSLPAQLRSGALLLSTVYVSDFSNVQLYRKLYGEPVNFIGYPTSRGSGSVAAFNNMFCINAKSKNKEGAWAFIRQFLLPEYQKTLEWQLPVLKDAFEARIAKAMEPIDNEWGPNIWYYDDVEIEMGSLTEEEAQIVRDIVYGVTSTYGYDEQLFNIITEEVEYFFGGQKSARDAANIIQSKAQLYIDESR